MRHAHLDGAGCLPVGGVEGALGCQGSVEGLRRGGEGCAKGIAHGLEDITVVLLDGFSKEGVMAGNGGLHGAWVFLPQSSTPLYIGEEECDSAFGHLARSRHL